MYVLGIETSCDETALALLHFSASKQVTILAEEVSSQIDLHGLYGGVVPELASREHLRNLPIVLENVLKRSGVELKAIDIVGVTCGPGLLGCLLMGVNFARGLSLGAKLKLMPINHIEAHVFSVLLDNPSLSFPFLALIVSGGHTEIVQVKALGEYIVLARSMDDAAGEAFDKAANLLGLTYPGGAKLAALADTQSSSAFTLPKVMRNQDGFSFSGLKTAIALLVKRNPEANKAELSFSIQQAIVESLVFKLQQFIEKTGINKVALSGGVSCNKFLRKKVQAIPRVESYFAKPEHCIDNGAMIAFLAGMKFIQDAHSVAVLAPRARWRLEEVE